MTQRHGALLPGDGDDGRLLRHVRPEGWRNPAPPDRYDLVVIGGGTAGLVSAFLGAALGARVALVERALLGGDCLVTGCVPSKSLLHSAARAQAQARALAHEPERDTLDAREPMRDAGGDDARAALRRAGAAAFGRMRRVRADIAGHDAASRLARAGIDVHFGQATFTGEDALRVDDVALRFRRCVLATGARPALPDVPGLLGGTASILTSETVFGLAEVPGRLVVLGGGPIGCELGQAFARLGSRVTIVQRAPRLLPRDDEDASAVLARRLAGEGIDLLLGSSVAHVNGATITVRCPLGSASTLEADAVLVAAGRRANVDELALHAAGIRLDAKGFPIHDDFLRTTQRRVLVAGDVAGRWQFTHAADAMARLAVQNALLPIRRRVSRLLVPWCTYTDPEIAHVGVTAGRARELGLATVTAPMSDVDRAILEGRTEGFARLHVHPRTGRVLGATVVGPRAGETIAEAAVAMRAGLTAAALEDVIHCYPTHAEALRRAAAAWRRTRLKPWMPRVLRWWYRLLR